MTYKQASIIGIVLVIMLGLYGLANWYYAPSKDTSKVSEPLVEISDITYSYLYVLCDDYPELHPVILKLLEGDNKIDRTEYRNITNMRDSLHTNHLITKLKSKEIK